MELYYSLCRLWQGIFYCPSRRLRGQFGERVREAQDKVLEYLDYILEAVPTPDFVEVVGRVGGDTITYRVYNDGSVYEK